MPDEYAVRSLCTNTSAPITTKSGTADQLRFVVADAKASNVTPDTFTTTLREDSESRITRRVALYAGECVKWTSGLCGRTAVLGGSRPAV